MKVMKFSYLDEFSCIGPECSDSCCKHWRILLSKAEYKRYKNLRCSDELKSIINTAFKRNHGGSDMQYAEMQLSDNGSCPFLGDDSLCMLQKELGEEVLTVVCAAFPRLNMKVGGEYIIKTASVTCPHVVELLIAHPEGLNVTEERYDGSDRFINSKLFTGGTVPESREGMPSFLLIKSTQLGIIQNRGFTLSERLIILGFFSQKAQESFRDVKKMQALSAAMTDAELCRKIAGSLSAGGKEKNLSRTLEIVGEIAKLAETPGTIDRNTKALLDNMLDKIDFRISRKLFNGSVKTDCLFSADAVKEFRERYIRLEGERSYIFENILANMVFGERPDKGIWLNYFVLAVFYDMMRLFVPALLPENFSDRELAQAVTDVAKVVLNTEIAEKHIYKVFGGRGYTSLPQLAFLIG